MKKVATGKSHIKAVGLICRAAGNGRGETKTDYLLWRHYDSEMSCETIRAPVSVPSRETPELELAVELRLRRLHDVGRVDE